MGSPDEGSSQVIKALPTSQQLEELSINHFYCIFKMTKRWEIKSICFIEEIKCQDHFRFTRNRSVNAQVFQQFRPKVNLKIIFAVSFKSNTLFIFHQGFKLKYKLSESTY